MIDIESVSPKRSNFLKALSGDPLKPRLNIYKLYPNILLMNIENCKKF